jgi:hypothetical protein
MTQPRVDLFGIIHKMVRTELFSTASLIARTNFAGADDRGSTLAAFETTMGFLDEHAVHEDTYVLPALQAADAALAQKIADEHAVLDGQCKAMKDLAANLSNAEGDAAVPLGAQLHRAFSDFCGAYLSHLSVEEGAVNEALWAKFTDDELANVRAELQGSIPPPRFAEWFALMVPAMNLQERIGVLTGMKMNAPPPVFEAMSGVARKSIGEDAWAKVAAALPG